MISLLCKGPEKAWTKISIVIVLGVYLHFTWAIPSGRAVAASQSSQSSLSSPYGLPSTIAGENK